MKRRIRLGEYFLCIYLLGCSARADDELWLAANDPQFLRSAAIPIMSLRPFI
jgi:hypothetical protein